MTAAAAAAAYATIGFDLDVIRERDNVNVRKKTVNGEKYNMVTLERGPKGGFSTFGIYVTRESLNKKSTGSINMMVKYIEPKIKQHVNKDVINIISEFMGYTDDDIKNINSRIYMSLYNATSIYRSTIFDEEFNMVGIAPPKSMYIDQFIEMFKDEFKEQHNMTGDIVFYEMIEGTMINAFYHNGRWNLSTKYHLDGSSKTQNKYIDAFKETCDLMNVDLDSLDTSLCYSFVFQNPKIVCINEYQHHDIYLVALYKIDNSNHTVLRYDLSKVTKKVNVAFTITEYRYDQSPTIRIPERIFANFDDLDLIKKEWGLPREVLENDPYEGRHLMHNKWVKGIVMYHRPSGISTKVINRHWNTF